MCTMNNWLLAMLQHNNSCKYVKADERISHIVRPLHEKEPLEYLRGLAHNHEMH